MADYQYKNLFMRYLDDKGVPYSDIQEDRIKLDGIGDNLNSIPIFVTFGREMRVVTVNFWNIANFKNREAAGILACNYLNQQNAWCKFWLDEDADVIAQIDSFFDEDGCGSDCLTLVKIMRKKIDETYPEFMRALWGN